MRTEEMLNEEDVSVLFDRKMAGIIRFLARKGGSYLGEMSRELNISKPTIAKKIKGLKKEGYLEENWIEVPAAEASRWIKKINIKEDKKGELLEKLKLKLS